MVYVTGDMHGDIERFSERKLKKLKAEDTLIILGDFGFVWQNTEEEKKNLEFISKRRFKTLFIDGTHENHKALKEFPETELFGGRVRSLGGNLYMLCRGEVYNIEDKKILAFGGGQSDDKEFRVEGQTWFEEELPSIEEIENAKKNIENCGGVDYIVTHDAPHTLKTSFAAEITEKNRFDSILDELMVSGKYKKWYFGRYHTDRKITRMQYAVYRGVVEIETPEKKSFFKRIFKKK